MAADGTAGMAMAVTQIATAAAALTWMFCEWSLGGRPSALGIASGAVAGLVAITPASGFVGPMGAIAIGLAAGLACYFAAVRLKRILGYDDALDAFGVHAVGGIVGALLTGVFVSSALGGSGLGDGMGIAGQLWIQAKAVLFTIVYDAVVTTVILLGLQAVIGLRVGEEAETEGLDLSSHGERGYVL